MLLQWLWGPPWLWPHQPWNVDGDDERGCWVTKTQLPELLPSLSRSLSLSALELMDLHQSPLQNLLAIYLRPNARTLALWIIPPPTKQIKIQPTNILCWSPGPHGPGTPGSPLRLQPGLKKLSFGTRVYFQSGFDFDFGFGCPYFTKVPNSILTHKHMDMNHALCTL